MSFCLTFRMKDCIFILTCLLVISCCFLTVHCTQPDCTSVADFDNCKGNVTGFCPENIVCACKDKEPFCKCPNFRGRWGNYWHMGTKCEQLWSTLDLILVAVLPGIGLALIVGVTIQTIHYCKKKSIKTVDEHREQKSFSGLQPQHNPTHVLETDMKHSQHDQGQYARSSSVQKILPRNYVSPPPQVSGKEHRFMIHEHQENNPYFYSSYNRERAQLEANYGNKYPSTMHMKPLFSYLTPEVPKSSYIQRERQEIGFQSPEEPEFPYSTGHMQTKPKY